MERKGKQLCQLNMSENIDCHKNEWNFTYSNKSLGFTKADSTVSVRPYLKGGEIKSIIFKKQQLKK